MEKTEERNLFSDKISHWVGSHKKKVWVSISAIYIIFVIIFSIIIINNTNGGIQAIQSFMNDYPEQEYQQLEQELKNIVVESDGIYPAELSNDSIQYDISYSEGKYTITLTDDVTTITGTIIGNDFKKEDLIIEREYKTEGEYRICHYLSNIAAILLISSFTFCFIALIIKLLLSIIYLIERLVKRYTAKK